MASSTSRAFVFSLFQDMLILGAILLSIYTRFLIEPFAMFQQHQAVSIAIVFVIYKACYHYFNLYQVNLHLSLREYASRLLAINIAALVILTIVYYLHPPLVIGRGILALVVLYVIVLTSLYRLLWGTFSRDVAFSKNLLVMGSRHAASVTLEEIDKYRHSGYRCAGVLSKDPERVGEEIVGQYRVIGSFDDAIRLCDERRIDMVIVAVDDARGNLPVDTLLELKIRGVEIRESTQFHEQFTGKILLEGLRASWFIFSEGFTISRFSQVSKRFYDVATAFILLVATAPISILAAILVKLTSRGPLIYKQERVGLRGRTFMLYKFRSMCVDSEKDGPVWAEKNDPRVTAVGYYLRRFRIDEIPQIVNVMKGEMSFVGPRPERPFFVGKLAKEIPFYSQRHLIKPGITGWAQVRYPYGSTIEDAKEKLQLDLYYIKNVSLLFDFKILLETTRIVFQKMAH